MNQVLENYIIQHSDPESDLLKELAREANVKLLRPRMISGHIQGRVLSMISKMIAPKRILEIGTFAGYSAICLAEGLNEEGLLYTIEIDDEMEDFAQSFISKSPLAKRINQIIGDVLEVLPTLNETFDLVFIDADKRDYRAYYDAIFDKVNKGGFILADNTLWDGKVVETVQPNDKQTQGILHFNDYVCQDERVEKIILPLRDGLTLIRKK